MNSSYFDQKIKNYFINILAKKPLFITDSETVRLWHDLFNDEELLMISKELSKIDSVSVITSEATEARYSSSMEKKQNSINVLRNIEDDLIDIDSAENIFMKFKYLPKETVKRISSIILKHAITKITEHKIIHNERLVEIQNLFKLNEVEMELMTLYYCAEYSEDFENIVQQPPNQEDIRYPSNAKAFIGNIVQYSAHQVMLAFGKSARLISLGILETGRQMKMSSEFVDYLSGFSNDTLIEKYAKKISTNESLKRDAHLIPSTKIDTLKAILESDQPSSILFYGKPGTGKTELAKTIAKIIGLELYAINILDSDGEDDRNLRKRALFAVQNHPSMSEQIILVDECDQLINSKPNYYFRSGSNDDQKAWLNEYLDNNKCKTIWITNSIESIDDSIIRRFNYILEFDELSNVQREKILKTISDKDQN